MTDLYPNLTRESLRVIVLVRPGEVVTPELVARATGTATAFAEVIADLNRVHMIDDDGTLTPLGERYAAMCRKAQGIE